MGKGPAASAACSSLPAQAWPGGASSIVHAGTCACMRSGVDGAISGAASCACLIDSAPCLFWVRKSSDSSAIDTSRLWGTLLRSRLGWLARAVIGAAPPAPSRASSSCGAHECHACCQSCRVAAPSDQLSSEATRPYTSSETASQRHGAPCPCSRAQDTVPLTGEAYCSWPAGVDSSCRKLAMSLRGGHTNPTLAKCASASDAGPWYRMAPARLGLFCVGAAATHLAREHG